MTFAAPLARISLSALAHNVQKIRALAPKAKLLPMVKANAYGHGMVAIAQALESLSCDALGVARWDEAKMLRAAGIELPIVIFSGLLTPEQMQWSADHLAHVVIHDLEQLSWLDQISGQLTVWLKINTGMNRLGLSVSDIDQAVSRVTNHQAVESVILCTHHACADQISAEKPMYQQQMERFWQIAGRHSKHLTSVANSATLLRAEQEQMGDWVRPGIMLYGGSPFASKSARSLDLKPVMKLEAPIVSVYSIAAGEGVGYGQTFVAKQPTQIAIVAMGYGDGLLRHAGGATKVRVDSVLCPIIGRVSMDLLVIDVTKAGVCNKGQMVTLWGEHYPVELMAADLSTINYELLTQVTARVKRLVED